ncbi:shikimate dehydrogenase [Candidatus Pelagibacter sp.]|uniref:shikimate dehydrogenase n=1 Tax=Candidatus Pelagibacter sp. TaxID=2024849 RepID=UPI003F831D04
MNKYLVIGNPIAHSLSPLLHNYWFKKYRFLDSIYEKKKVEKKDLKKIVEQIKNDEVKGVNVTVPFKREIFNFIDTAPYEVQFTKSVNTLVKENDKVVGYNTDQQGFEISLEENDWDCKDKKILIIGAGGVAPSILSTLIKVDGAEKIYLSNRTRSKAEELKKFWDKALGIYQMKKDTIEIIDWEKKSELCDLIINTTSVGLTKDEKLNFDFSDYNNKKDVLFYDLIYNPKETNFLKDARMRGNRTMNGKMMFLWQAHLAFKMWTGVSPIIDEEVIKLLD